MADGRCGRVAVCAHREGVTPIVWAFELLAQTMTPAGARKDGEKKTLLFTRERREKTEMQKSWEK